MALSPLAHEAYRAKRNNIVKDEARKLAFYITGIGAHSMPNGIPKELRRETGFASRTRSIRRKCLPFRTFPRPNPSVQIMGDDTQNS